MNDDLKGLLADRFRPMAVGYLDECLRLSAKRKLAFDQLAEDHPGRVQAARDILLVLVQAIGGLAGDEVIAAAYGVNPPDEAPRDRHLEALWFRLWVARELFKPVDDPAAQSSIQALCDEVLAVAHGDKPKLLARVVSHANGVGGSRYRLANRQIRALEWEQFLLGQGLAPGDVQSRIISAFANTPWSTIRGWRRQCDQALGENVVSYLLGIAANGWHWHFLPLRDDAEAWSLLKADGQDFDRARRENADGPAKIPHKPRKGARNIS